MATGPNRQSGYRPLGDRRPLLCQYAIRWEREVQTVLATPVLVHNTNVGCFPFDGVREFLVFDPVTGNMITDIDHIYEGVLWEEKGAICGDESWMAKHITAKLAKYLKSRPLLPGYENAPIGFRFTNPNIDPRFRMSLEKYFERLRIEHPGLVS